MALPTSNISLQAIQAEVGHSTTSNISLQAQSTNAPEHGSYTLLNDAPYGMNEFSGYEAISLDSFPNLSSGWTNTSKTGASGSTGFDFRGNQASNQTGIQVNSFSNVYFTHDTTNNWIRIAFNHGNQNAMATTYYQFIDYVGLGSATWEARYEYPNTTSAIDTYERYQNETLKDRATHPDTSLGGNYSENTYYSIPTSGSLQFPWVCVAEYNNFNDNAEAQLGDAVFAGHQANDVRFTVRATLSGTSYTATSSTFTIDLSARRGLFLP